MATNLSAYELLKPGRENRIDIFFDKIKEGKEFLLVSGKFIKLKEDVNAEAAAMIAFKARDSKTLNKIELTDIHGHKYKFADFSKTGEFGGRGAGSGTVAEDAALADIKKKLNALLIEIGMPYIKVKVGNTIVHMADIISTPGTPKADFHVLDEHGNEVAWISHKKGSKANDFQQYGGMVEIANESEVMLFAKDVKKALAEQGLTRLPMKTAFARPVESKRVILKSVYGKDYKNTVADSRQNINVLYQGPMEFEKKGDFYIIKSNHTMIHGEIPSGDYECYYYCRPAQDRTQFGVPGARFFIVAKKTAIMNRNTKVI
jgi:hypothetical protein